MPDLVGMTPVEAVAALNGLDLKLDPTDRITVRQTGGHDREPEAGRQTRRVPAGTEVSIVVSSGPASTPVKVPDLVKMDQDAALAAPHPASS